jgi:transposase-like protein
MSKMQGKRRRRIHSREFKADAVQVVRTGGRTIGEVARDLGLAESLVRSWVAVATPVP